MRNIIIPLSRTEVLYKKWSRSFLSTVSALILKKILFLFIAVLFVFVFLLRALVRDHA